MSETFGLVSIGGDENKCSVEVISKADAEVSRIINESHSRALKILAEHKKELDLVASELLVKKTLYGDEIKSLINQRNVIATELKIAAKPRGITIQYEDQNMDVNEGDSQQNKRYVNSIMFCH